MWRKVHISAVAGAFVLGFALGAILFLSQKFVIVPKDSPHRVTEENTSTGLPFHLMPARVTLGTSIVKRLDENNWRYTFMNQDKSGKHTGFHVFRLRRVNAGKEYMDATAEIRQTN
ncbi:MAG: hypothetical protein OXI69_03175 [Acidobacteriota bacterium]|nr:hypothetical protein [Acidobacteriota bacterium]